METQRVGVNFDNIPLVLKQTPQWLVWGDEKKPYNAHTGKPTGVNWGDAGNKFSVARSAYETGAYRGIGFILSAPIVGVDLDHCVSDGVIDNYAYDIMTDLCSYTEFSPSGNGLHILVRGDLPGNRITKRIELYSHDKYLTVTGDVLGAAYTGVVEDTEDVLLRLYESTSTKEGIAPPTIPTMRQGNGKGRRTDNQAIDALLRYGHPHVKALWGGVWSKARYSSQSEADIALVRYLWYYSNEYEPLQVDRLFRRSGLYNARPGKGVVKWDDEVKSAGTTYGWYTIGKVIGV